MANVPHKITIGSSTASIVLPDNYQNDNSTVGAEVGITKVSDSNKIAAGTFPIGMDDGLKHGLLIRLIIRHKGDGETAKSKSSRIVCAIDKAYTASTSLVGKKYRGNTITSVSVPQRIYYH